MRRTVVIVTLLVTAVVPWLTVVPAKASGNTFTWGGGGSTTAWTNIDNWTPSEGAPPKDGDIVELNGGFTATDAPGGLHLQKLTMGGGFQLFGAAPDVPMTVDEFSWSGGRLAQGISSPSITITDISGDPGPLQGRLILDNGAADPGLHTILENTGTVTFISTPAVAGQIEINGAAYIENKGTFTVLPLPLASTEVRITGATCCANPAMFRNWGTVQIGQDVSLRLENMKLLNLQQRKITGAGRLVLYQGQHVLKPGSQLKARFVDVTGGARVDIDAVDPPLALGSTTTLQLHDFADLRGDALVRGGGTVKWTGGRVYANLEIDAGTTMLIERSCNADGTPIGIMELSAGYGGGKLTNRGIVRQTGCFLHNGSIKNEGRWEVPGGVSSGMIAGGCCSRPFLNRSLLKVPPTATMAFRNMRFDQRGNQDNIKIAGGGTVELHGGGNYLGGTTWIRDDGTTLALRGNAQVHGVGELCLDPGTEIVQKEGSDLFDTLQVCGSGTYRWDDGFVYADLALWSGITFDLTAPPPPAPGRVLSTGYGKGTIVASGTTTQWTATPIKLFGPTAQITNEGTWKVFEGGFEGAGFFTNKDSLVVDTGAAKASWDYVQFRGRGDVLIRTGEAHFTHAAYGPILTGGTTAIRAGTKIVGDKPVIVDGATLYGDGVISGGLTLKAGIVEPGGKETLTLSVVGPYRQFGGQLEIWVGNTVHRRLSVSGACTLGGVLNLSGGDGLSDATPKSLVACTSLTGRFGAIAKPSTWPSAWKVRYTTSQVRLVKE